MAQSASFDYVLDDEEFHHGGKAYRTGRAVVSRAAFIRDRYSFPAHEPVWPNEDNPHMLPCLNGDPNSEFIFWVKFDQSLANRMERLKNSGIKPLMEYMVPCEKGSGSQPTNISYVPEVYRKYFRSMVRFLNHIHDLGFATEGFGLENIVLFKGKIKFFGLNFRKLNASTQQSEISADFGHLSNLIGSIYSGLPGELPWEFNRWIDDLFTYNSKFDGLLINHVATLTHHERLNLMRELFERHSEDECRKLFCSTISKASFELRYLSWASRIKEDGSPIAHFYAKAYQRALDGQIQLYQDTLLDLLRFSRNFMVHVGEDSSLFVPTGGITPKYKDIALFDLFGRELYTIQLKANEPPEYSTTSLLSCLDYSDEGIEVEGSELDNIK